MKISLTSIINLHVKTLLFIFAFGLFATSLLGQENWNLENGELRWVRVYESSLSFIEISTSLSLVKDLSDIQILDKAISFQLSNHTPDKKKYGIAHFAGPALLNLPISGDGLLEYKEGRYRITLENLTAYNEVVGDIDFVDTYTKKKRTEFRTSQTTVQSINIINREFTEMFELSVGTNDDW